MDSVELREKIEIVRNRFVENGAHFTVKRCRNSKRNGTYRETRTYYFIKGYGIMNENHYLLLTPGPLTTTKSVKEVMLYDWCTWDVEYNTMVQEVRAKLVSLATKEEEKYTTVLMQGSGTFSVEAVIGSVIPGNGKLLVCTNGAYGKRIVQMAEMLQIDVVVSQTEEWNLLIL